MHQNRRKKLTPRKKQPRRRQATLIPLTSVPRMRTDARRILPPEMDIVLAYQPNKTALNAGASTCGIRFYANGAYDVDPVLGSTTMPGFTTFIGTSTTTGLYNYYRVIRTGYNISICNNESFPVRVYTGFTNTDPGTVGNIQLPGNPMFKNALLSAKGGNDRVTFKDSKTIATIVGSSGVETEDNFRGVYNANPVDLTYLFVGGNSVAGAFLPNGISIAGSITMTIRFYDSKVEFA
jgi:hypothetical protein